MQSEGKNEVKLKENAVSLEKIKHLLTFLLGAMFILLSGTEPVLPISETNPIEDTSEVNEKIQETRSSRFQFYSFDEFVSTPNEKDYSITAPLAVGVATAPIVVSKRYLKFRVLLI